jgi:SPP1 gp7 family putative phage head morphogenesis protein
MSGNVINKKINIEIKDITEGNRQQKFEQLAKCLNGLTPEYVPADNTSRLPDIKISLKNNEPARVEKALRTMSMSLRLPGKAAKGEVFFYKAQEDLTDKWCDYFSNYIQNIYDFVTEYCDLPKKTVMSKAENLTYKGKILYSPSTGEPIKKADWEKFLKNLEKFLNRNNDNPAERIVLQSQCLAKILNRMLKYNTLEAVKKLRLEDTAYHGKSFDWISKDIKNMKDVFGEELTRQEQARIEIYQQSAAVKVQNVTEKVRGEIQQVLIDGVRAKKSKSQVSQDLFDKMVGDNRDYQRLADTEVQNAFNNSFIREEVQNTPENKKTYFRRIEIIDGNTCPFCRQMNGKIAVWSDKPLQSDIAKDPIADYVLWEGKEWNGKEHTVAIGCFHPWCRGTWERYDESDAHIDALIAENSNRAKKWNNAVKQATKEFEEKGVKNPDDSTKGFTDRIQEIFNSEDVQKSLDGEKDNHTRHYFSKSELRKRGEELLKIYEKICKETGLDMETVVNRYGITKDGCYYDLENPKEKFYFDLKNKVDKSLTWSGHKLQGRTTFNGLNISIENKKGSIRRGTDSDGHEWAITMHYDYGYIRGTEGVDGDHVDCYLGGNEDAKNVYIIHQKIPGTDKYDEDKCMLGFDTLADAKAAYLRQYDKPGFFGGVDTVPFDVFKEKVLSKKWHGKRLNLK